MNQQLAIKPYIQLDAKAWLRFRNGSSEVVRLVRVDGPVAQQYAIYTAYDIAPDCLGQILFDSAGFWIYDGDLLHPDEQEQLAHFIMNYVEKI